MSEAPLQERRKGPPEDRKGPARGERPGEEDVNLECMKCIYPTCKLKCVHPA